MSQLNEIQCAINQYKPNDNHEWMTDPIYDHFSLPILKSVQNYHQSIPGYTQTPLVDLKQFASDIGVDKVWIKDESKRFNLNAFKVLGASYSLAKKLVTDSCDATNIEKQGKFFLQYLTTYWLRNSCYYKGIVMYLKVASLCENKTMK